MSEKCDTLLIMVKVRKMGWRVRVCRVLKVGGAGLFCIYELGVLVVSRRPQDGVIEGIGAN